MNQQPSTSRLAQTGSLREAATLRARAVATATANMPAVSRVAVHTHRETDSITHSFEHTASVTGRLFLTVTTTIKISNQGSIHTISHVIEHAGIVTERASAELAAHFNEVAVAASRAHVPHAIKTVYYAATPAVLWNWLTSQYLNAVMHSQAANE